MDKFLSIDIETTGLNSEKHQILEFAAVVGDFSGVNVETYPHFVRRFYYDELRGDPFALNMNRELIAQMPKRGGIIEWISLDSLWSSFGPWLHDNKMFPGYNGCTLKKIPVTGKNFSGFDVRFLEKAPRFQIELCHHRVLDIGSLYFEPETDITLPSMEECIKKSGLGDKAESFIAANVQGLHTALTDARTVIELINHYYSKYRFEVAIHRMYRNQKISFDRYEALCAAI